MKIKNLPTSRKILKTIYQKYYLQFCSYDKNNPQRSAKIYVPIDIKAIADDLNVDPDIIFGRLYYHLDNKYRYTQSDGSQVYLFSLKVGDDKHAVNFPMLSAILSEFHEKWVRFTIPLFISALALLISLSALLF